MEGDSLFLLFIGPPEHEKEAPKPRVTRLVMATSRTSRNTTINKATKKKLRMVTVDDAEEGDVVQKNDKYGGGVRTNYPLGFRKPPPRKQKHHTSQTKLRSSKTIHETRHLLDSTWA